MAFAVVSIVCIGMFSSVALTQQDVASCTFDKGAYTCNWSAFKDVLQTSRTVAVENEPMDQPTGAQLKELARKLGKTVAVRERRADLTFVVVPADEPGIAIGPADQEILELKIYAGGNSDGKLVWVESYRGQQDRPWGANVHEAVEQFQARFAKR
jgi:hypothetical protein